MQDSTSKETHFQFVEIPPSLVDLLHSLVSIVFGSNDFLLLFTTSVTITSNEFQAKSQPARHRLVYALLKDEMSREGGIHALQLRTRTPEEEQKQAHIEKETR
jgi:acid stress-induced BolA-like protein IbaG/YrbA